MRYSPSVSDSARRGTPVWHPRRVFRSCCLHWATPWWCTTGGLPSTRNGSARSHVRSASSWDCRTRRSRYCTGPACSTTSASSRCPTRYSVSPVRSLMTNGWSCSVIRSSVPSYSTRSLPDSIRSRKRYARTTNVGTAADTPTDSSGPTSRWPGVSSRSETYTTRSTHPRSYRPNAFPADTAIEHLITGAGRLYDPDAVAAFCRSHARAPR